MWREGLKGWISNLNFYTNDSGKLACVAILNRFTSSSASLGHQDDVISCCYKSHVSMVGKH